MKARSWGIKKAEVPPKPVQPECWGAYQAAGFLIMLIVLISFFGNK